MSSTENVDSTALFTELVSFEFAREHLLLPVERAIGSDGHPVIKCLSVRNIHMPAVDNLSLLLDAPIELEVRPEPVVQEAIRQAYQAQMAGEGMRHAESHLRDGEEAANQDAAGARVEIERELGRLADRDLLAFGHKAPVAKLVDALLFDALSRKASDLHVHPYPPSAAARGASGKLVIRYRVDGVLFDAYTPDPKLHDQLVGRIKVLAGMDVAEKRLPQDGRTSVTV